MLTVLINLALLLILPALPIASAQRPVGNVTMPGCPSTVFSGTVQAGQEFEKELAGGLVFCMTAESDSATPGWTIRIHEKNDAERARDFLMVATPPFRSWNPRYLNVSHGMSAKESVAIRIREFSFVPNRAEFERFNSAMRKSLWSYGHSEQEVQEATKVIMEAPRCQGEMRILDARITEAEEGGKINWLKFEVVLGLKKKAGT